jgi:hypothetical protein
MLMHRDKTESSIEPNRVLGLRLTILGIALLALLGCSFLSFQPPVEVPVAPVETPTVVPTLTPTWPPAWTATPTFTPWPPTPTWTPTATPEPTGTPRPSGQYRPSAKVSRDGPLTIDFKVVGAWCHEAGYITEVQIWADGGGGGYTYFRDCYEIDGPTDDPVSYQIRWADCGGAPGTFTVKSADGQEVYKLFWLRAPSCCK